MIGNKEYSSRKILAYEISEVTPYINWLYFYHAWGLSGKPKEEKEKMQNEALGMLESWQGKYHTHGIFRLLEANSEGDDIVLFDGSSIIRIPMLRQQKASSEGEPNLCLADFIRPLSQQKRDQLGLFCTTVDAEIVELYHQDDYLSMLAQTLCDRLAEASAERLHEQVRKEFWGYAPDEHLTMEQSHREEYQGIRPAVGYPSMPDTSVNFILNELLGMKDVNIRLTESGMMTPHSSVSGLMFAHPKARYFELGKIGEDQLRDYAKRRGIPLELMRRFLQSSLLKK
jgi:cobalamin-dependent methionine synthase I